ncbi:conserved protein of unknown function [Limnospira indica PCC 8005]|uniref:Uncharacterized protein n=1 Tax=Limnospira indica PCC 8005 TaxID=376219 RepID=A0A9P1P0X5_9CYAN|nr:conserved protein of unknown function [Limnospira indica PCC 8005]
MKLSPRLSYGKETAPNLSKYDHIPYHYMLGNYVQKILALCFDSHDDRLCYGLGNSSDRIY